MTLLWAPNLFPLLQQVHTFTRVQATMEKATTKIRKKGGILNVWNNQYKKPPSYDNSSTPPFECGIQS